MRPTLMTLMLVAAALIWAQTTVGPVTPIVTGGTVKVATGTPVVSGGTSIVSGGTTVIGGGGAAPAVWTQVQGKWGTFVTSGTTLSVTLTSAPTAGNLVVCNLQPAPYTTSSITDNAGALNTYTVTPHSPSAASGSAGKVTLAYLVAPAGAGATITATLGTAVTVGSIMGCEEFHLSSGTPAFDTDVAGSRVSGTGNTANTPSITGSAAGELLVGAAYVQLGFTTADSPWTLWPGGLMGSDGGTTGCGSTRNCPFGDEVILSSSGTATALSFTNVSNAGQWNSLIAAFKGM